MITDQTNTQLKVLKASHQAAFDHYEISPGSKFIGAPYQKLNGHGTWYQLMSTPVKEN